MMGEGIEKSKIRYTVFLEMEDFECQFVAAGMKIKRQVQEML